jgi:hypothetical protein
MLWFQKPFSIPSTLIRGKGCAKGDEKLLCSVGGRVNLAYRGFGKRSINATDSKELMGEGELCRQQTPKIQ